MIIQSILELVFSLLQVVFKPINLPAFPSNIQGVIDQLKELLLNSVNLFSVFVDFKVLRWCVPIVIVIANLDKVWKLIMFILRKIPFLGIE